MVELIVVMLLIGILGAVGVARFFDRTGYDADAFTEQTRAMLRYAQKIAIAQNRPAYVRFDSGRIALCLDKTTPCPSGSQVLAPSGSNSGTAATTASCASATWYCEGIPQGVSVVLPTGTSFLSFDALGRPFNDAGALVPSGLALNIRDGVVGRQISVAPETGYVY
jgi:MSHA pilin protein MshC